MSDNEKKPATVLKSASPGWLRWAISIGLLIVSIALQVIASAHPGFVEQYYSRNLYPHICRGLAYANRLCGFSLAEALLVLLVAGATYSLARQIRRIWRREFHWQHFFLSGIANTVGLSGLGLLLFLSLWGLNYERKPLSENLRMDHRAVNGEELESVTRAIIVETNRAYEETHGNADYRASTKVLGTTMPMDWDGLNEVIETSYQHEKLLEEAAAGGYGPPKPVFFSNLMSRFGISGIYIPFTGEPNFNAEQPDCELPFTIAHEKAHQRGFALEDEANFIAFLICIKSPHPFTRYSGFLMAASHTMSTLYHTAPERYFEVLATLSPGPRADLHAVHEFWHRYEGKLTHLSETVNNTYLKANHVDSGVENYSEVVELIIGYYFTYPTNDTPHEAPADLSRK